MDLLRGPASKIALIQSVIYQDAKEENLQHNIKLLEEASDSGADIICLSENFATGVSFPSVRRMAEEEADSQILNTICTKARLYKKCIIFGMLEKDRDDYFHTAYVVNSFGIITGKYRRHALLGEEQEIFRQGPIGHVIHTDYGNVGILLGYDIRFPFTCENYFREKAILIVCLSNNLVEYSFPIRSICRARAADNMCYFVYLNCLGLHKYMNKKFCGGSMVIDGSVESIKSEADSDIIAKANNDEMILFADLYFNKMKRYQKKPTTRYLMDFEKFSKLNNKQEDR